MTPGPWARQRRGGRHVHARAPGGHSGLAARQRTSECRRHAQIMPLPPAATTCLSLAAGPMTAAHRSATQSCCICQPSAGRIVRQQMHRLRLAAIRRSCILHAAILPFCMAAGIDGNALGMCGAWTWRVGPGIRQQAHQVAALRFCTTPRGSQPPEPTIPRHCFVSMVQRSECLCTAARPSKVQVRSSGALIVHPEHLPIGPGSTRQLSVSDPRRLRGHHMPLRSPDQVRQLLW